MFKRQDIIRANVGGGKQTTILPSLLCGCETWSLALREKCRLRVFENRNLREIFRLKRDEKLHSLYLSG